MKQVEVEQHRPVHGVWDAALREQLLGRRQKLRNALEAVRRPDEIVDLLHEVDAALARMDAGTFGICETCHEPVEGDRLLADPLCRNCLDHLSPGEQRALEHDLNLALQVQRGLLPDAAVSLDGWKLAYCYEPAGPVSGDYCDVIPLEQGAGFLLLGDVSGKGVAASMLMANLHAIFRSLASADRSVAQLVACANRIFCQGRIASHFATLVCGRIYNNGDVDLCNGGHCMPLHVSCNGVVRIDSSGLPLGIVAEGEYGSFTTKLASGDSLVLYSDGLSEGLNPTGKQYGVQRLTDLLHQQSDLPPQALLAIVLEDLKSHRSGAKQSDDLTVMVVRRE
jgi:sigma-B regulation protein RsbU (phosphoserine phosphatase)